MEITDIKIRKIIEEGKMKAVVSVVLDNKLVIHDIKVIKTEEKIFIAMPNKKMPDGTFKDVVHPLESTFRKELETRILEEYEKNI